MCCSCPDSLDFPKAFTVSARQHSNSTPPLSLRRSESPHAPPSPTSSSSASKSSRLHLTRTRVLNTAVSPTSDNRSNSTSTYAANSPPFGATNNSSPSSPTGSLSRKLPPPGPRTLPRTQTMPRNPPPASLRRPKRSGDTTGVNTVLHVY